MNDQAPARAQALDETDLEFVNVPLLGYDIHHSEHLKGLRKKLLSTTTLTSIEHNKFYILKQAQGSTGSKHILVEYVPCEDSSIFIQDTPTCWYYAVVHAFMFSSCQNLQSRFVQMKDTNVRNLFRTSVKTTTNKNDFVQPSIKIALIDTYFHIRNTIIPKKVQPNWSHAALSSLLTSLGLSFKFVPFDSLSKKIPKSLEENPQLLLLFQPNIIPPPSVTHNGASYKLVSAVLSVKLRNLQGESGTYNHVVAGIICGEKYYVVDSNQSSKIEHDWTKPLSKQAPVVAEAYTIVFDETFAFTNVYIYTICAMNDSPLRIGKIMSIQNQCLPSNAYYDAQLHSSISKIVQQLGTKDEANSRELATTFNTILDKYSLLKLYKVPKDVTKDGIIDTALKVVSIFPLLCNVTTQDVCSLTNQEYKFCTVQDHAKSNNKSIMFVYVSGIGTKGVDADRVLPVINVLHEVPVLSTFFNYESQGLIKNAKDLRRNTYNVHTWGKKKSETEDDQRTRRLIQLIQKLISYNSFNIVLIGISHGSVIIHKALLKMNLRGDMNYPNLFVYTLGSPQYLSSSVLDTRLESSLLPRVINYYHSSDPYLKWLGLLKWIPAVAGKFKIPSVKQDNFKADFKNSTGFAAANRYYYNAKERVFMWKDDDIDTISGDYHIDTKFISPTCPGYNTIMVYGYVQKNYTSLLLLDDEEVRHQTANIHKTFVTNTQIENIIPVPSTYKAKQGDQWLVKYRYRVEWIIKSVTDAQELLLLQYLKETNSVVYESIFRKSIEVYMFSIPECFLKKELTLGDHTVRVYTMCKSTDARKKLSKNT